MKKPLITLLFAAAATWGVLMLSVERAEPRETEQEAHRNPPVGQQAHEPRRDSQLNAPPSGRAATMRAMHAAVDRAQSSVDSGHLEAYLDGLLARARRQGKITAQEAGAGMEMIMRLGGDPAEQADFTSRINALSQELRQGQSPTQKSAPSAEQRVEELGQQLERGDISDTAERSSLVKDYVRAIPELDMPAQQRAMDRLNALAARNRAAVPTPDVGALLDDLERATGPRRQEVLSSVTEALATLPEEARDQHMDRLNAITEEQRGDGQAQTRGNQKAVNRAD